MGKQKGGREEEKRREGKEERGWLWSLESGGRRLLRPDVNLSKQPGLHSQRAPVGLRPSVSLNLLWIYFYWEKCTKDTKGSTASVPKGNGLEMWFSSR